jgi:CheY-specific phosphatase CheX
VSGGNDRGPAGELCFLKSTQGESLEQTVATIFFESAQTVFEGEFGGTPTTTYGSARSQPFTDQDLVVEIEISGDLSGRACYGFSAEVIATLGGTLDEVGQFDAYFESLVQELANMITGRTLIQLEQNGHRCDITPRRCWSRTDSHCLKSLTPARRFTSLMKAAPRQSGQTCKLAMSRQTPTPSTMDLTRTR